MKKIIFFLIFILGFSFLLKAEEINLSLDEAVAIALRENRDILLKTEQIKKAKLKLKESKTALLPTLSLSSSLTETKGYYSKDPSQISSNLSLKQIIYKGGRIINTIKLSEYGIEIAEAVLDKVRLELALNVKKAFYTLLLAKEYTNLNKDILENTQRHLESLKIRYENGQASESELLRLAQALENIKSIYEASLNQIEASLALLKNLLYLEEKVEINPLGELTYEPREVAYDEGFLLALKRRPEIRQYEVQEKANQKQIEIIKADNRPTIFASWDYYSRSHNMGLAGLTKNWNDYNVFGLNISWPIFDGWQTKTKIEQAIVDLKELQLSKEKLIKDIALELKKAYLDLKDSIAKLKAQEAEVKTYEDNLKVLTQRYQEGLASDLDLMDAQLQYKIAQFKKKETIYDYLVAKNAFDKATGGI